MEENRKTKGKICIFLGFVLICIFLGAFVRTNNDAISVRADIAYEETIKILSNSEQAVDTTELDIMELKMNICKVGMVIGAIVVVIGIYWCIVPEKKKIVHTVSNKYEVQKKIISEAPIQKNNIDKIRELKEMLDSKLITEEEYDRKKAEILNRM